MIKAATHGAGRANLRYALSNRKAFRTSGALSADSKEGTGNAYFSVTPGRLSGFDLEQFKADRDNIVYVVWSYGTPIAWAGADGSIYRVQQKFSVTTSRHQGMLYLLK